MKKSISWILEFTSNLPNKKEKIKCLQANAHPSIINVLKYCYDPKIVWLIPEGVPPYKHSPDPNIDFMFYHESRKLYLFVEGGNPNLQQSRREYLFISMLQSLNEGDSKLLLSIKDKKLPYKGLDSKLILEAFPDLY